MAQSDTFTVTPDGDRRIVFERRFNAPRPLVWEAMTAPDFVRQWLTGPPGWVMETCDEDFSEGGAYHWQWRHPDGMMLSMRGTNLEIEAPVRLVRTETFDHGCEAQAGEQIATLALTEEGERTHMLLVVEYPSREARDAALSSGMEQGMAHSYSVLDEVLMREVA